MTRFARIGASSIFLFLAILLIFSRLSTQTWHSGAFFITASVVLSLGIVALMGKRTDVIIGLSSILSFFAILLVWSFATRSFYDPGFDGYAYHLSAIWDIAAGWNPFLSSHSNIWVDSYPNGYWVLQSYIVGATGLLMSGQSLIAGLTAAVFLLAYSFFIERFETLLPYRNQVLALLFAGIIAGNPVVIGQLLTHYVDAPLYVFGAALVLFMLSDTVSPNWLTRLGIVACIILMVNTKTAALYYAPLLVFGGFIAEIAYRSSNNSPFTEVFVWIKHKGILYGFAFIFSVVAVGYKPYVTNIADHGDLLYPPVEQIMKGNEPSNVIPLSAPMKFIYGIFARTDHSEWPIDAPIEIKVPGTFHVSEFKFMRFDTRRGGFGPFFSLALIVSIASYGIVKLASRDKSKYKWHRTGDSLALFGIAMIAISMFFPESWWARYVPFAWPGVLFLSVAAIFLEGRGRMQMVSRILVGIALLSFIGCILASGLGAIRESKLLFERTEKIEFLARFPEVKLIMFYDPPAIQDFQSTSTQDGLSVWSRLLADRQISTVISRERDQFDCDMADYLNGGIYWCIVIDELE